MRRGKKPPTPEIVQLASVVSDALTLGRRADVQDDVKTLVPIALAEYLRRFPNARNATNRVWMYLPNARLQEMDYCCFFCRESLVTLPMGRTLTIKLQNKLNEHGELCGISLLAGLVTGAGPHGEAPKAANRSDR